MFHVVKRDGTRGVCNFDKITERNRALTRGLNPIFVDPILVTQQVVQGVFPGVHTTELDMLAAREAAAMGTIHPDYGRLAARIEVSNLKKQIHRTFGKSFVNIVAQLHKYVDPKTDLPAGLISDHVFEMVQKHGKILEAAIVEERDDDYDYFGIKTLMHGYLLKMNGQIAETPQFMLMRVAVGIHTVPPKGEVPASLDLEACIESYKLMSKKYFTHATPTLFNAGTRKPQLSSCFLLSMREDSIEGIYDTLKQVAIISKYAGGIGLSVSNIRARGAYIRGTNGTSNGLVPMLQVFNTTARYVDQCFHPDTIIWTSRGPKRIADVTQGDQCLSQTGTWSQVDKLLTYTTQESKVLKIKTQQGITTRVTPIHQILAIQPAVVVRPDDHDGLVIRLEKKHVRAEMVDAATLREGDWLVIPRPDTTTEVDIERLSVEDCRLYGILLMRAYITHGVIVVSLPWEGYKSTVDFIQEYGRIHSIHMVTHVCDGEVRINWKTTSRGYPFRLEQLRNDDKTPIMDPGMMNLPQAKLEALLQGICDAKAGDKTDDIHFMGWLSSAIEWMFLRCGILLSHIDENTVVLPRRVNDDKRDLRYPCVDGKFYVPITHIGEQDYKGQVMDVELAATSDHTYTTQMGLVHNGGGKRKGAFSIYVEPWHADIFEFLDLKKPTGNVEDRARDLFYALWIPDLFMKRVEEDGSWSLFCPTEAPGLYDHHSKEFEDIYLRHEATPGKARRVIKARELFRAIEESQTETGGPYMLYKDQANRKSNQQNLGTIRCSNLCTEILEYTSPDECAVCNLASIALPMFVSTREKKFNFKKLFDVVQVATKNLNKVIDINFYPVKEAENSNLRHRPIGLGVQGLADAFIILRMPFDSPEAKKLNKEIFETIYFAALSASKDLAARDGPYASYAGSPVSKNILQMDMWGLTEADLSGMWDWKELRSQIAQFGVRNSLLVAPMPTASTSQILGNNEAFEPFTSNIYVRRTLAGEFVVVSPHLVRDLIQLGLWGKYDMRQLLIHYNGSVQNIAGIPADIKALYRTVWEIPQKEIVHMAADRSPFIDQSHSLNIHMTPITPAKLTSLHFLTFKLGLKTALYYLRGKPAVDAIQFTVNPILIAQEKKRAEILNRIVSSTSSLESKGDSHLNVVVPPSPSPGPQEDAVARQQSDPTPTSSTQASLTAQEECSLNNPDSCLMCGS